MSKLYLVRWPEEHVSMVTAEDEAQLFDAIVANMGENVRCTFEPYMGENLFLTFRPRPSPFTKRSPLHVAEPAEPQEEALKDFSSLFTNQLFADVEIKVEDKLIPCHRAILAQRCKYFHAMFVSNMQESKQRVIRLSGFSFEVVNAVIKFLYTGILDIPTLNSENENRNNGRMSPDDARDFNKDTKFPFLVEVLEASDFFGLSSLHKLCVTELIKVVNSDPTNFKLAEQLFNLGVKLDLECFKDQACFTLGKELSRCVVLCDQDVSQDYAAMSLDLQRHLKDVWEERLRQYPILFGKDRELMDCLTISSPAADMILTKVKELISQGAIPTNIGALHVICQHWNVISDKEEEIFKQLVKIFLESGCDINSINYSEHSPLHIAAKQGRISHVKTLLSLGANPHLKCLNHSYTPLEEMAYGFDEQVGILLKTPALASPSRLIAYKRGAFNACLSIHEILAEAMKSSPKTVNDGVQEETNFAVNEYFIDRLFKHNELDTSARIEFDADNLGMGRKELEDTLFEFMFPKFSGQLDALQQKSMSSGAAVETTEAKKLLQCSLKADLADAYALKGSGNKLASLQRMQNDGKFAHLKADTWIHSYNIADLLLWEDD